MKPVKRIPFIIFVTVLAAGIIGVIGMSILKYDIDKLSKNYKQISDVHFVNKESKRSIPYVEKGLTKNAL